jgi:hypothetical protein
MLLSGSTLCSSAWLGTQSGVVFTCHQPPGKSPVDEIVQAVISVPYEDKRGQRLPNITIGTKVPQSVLHAMQIIAYQNPIKNHRQCRCGAK